MVLETNGVLSVFPSAENRPVTRAEQKLEKKYDGIPLTLILDGRIQSRTLALCGRDEQWLGDLLRVNRIERAKNVLVALLSTQGVLLVQEKGENGRLLNIPAIKPEEVTW